MKSDNNIKSLKIKIDQLRLFIQKAGFLKEKRRQYLNRSQKDFTRKRKLDISTTVTLVLGLLKKAWLQNY